MLPEAGIFKTAQNFCDDYDVDGEFVFGRWISKRNCSLPWFTPVEASEILKSRRIVFCGDSMIRQIFLRMIWHLRGLDEIIENYFHSDAYYARNVTHDVFLVSSVEPNDDQRIVMPDFELRFIWDPSVGPSAAKIEALLRTEHQHIVVAGINYWRQDNATAEAVKLSNVTRLARLLWYPTPKAQYTVRNSFYRIWARRNGGFVLPSDRMAASNVFALNTVDNWHYQCSYLNLWPQANDGRFKTPASGDCRDLFNLNLVNIILGHAHNLN